MGALLGAGAEQAGALDLGFPLRLLEPSERSRKYEDVPGTPQSRVPGGRP